MTINCRNPQALICHDFILLLLLSFSSFWLFTYPMCLFVVAPIFLSFYSCLSLFLLRFLFFHCFCCCFHLLSVAGPTTSKGARAALLWHLPGVCGEVCVQGASTVVTQRLRRVGASCDDPPTTPSKAPRLPTNPPSRAPRPPNRAPTSPHPPPSMYLFIIQPRGQLGVHLVRQKMYK